MEITIRQREESQERAKYLSVLLHGWPGSGKTHTAGTAIEAGFKTFVVVPFEEELYTLDRMGWKSHDYYLVRDFGRTCLPLLRLPMHKIVTCLSEIDINPQDGSPRVYPLIQGGLQPLIAAYFSIVGFNTIVSLGNEVHYCLLTRAHPNVITKDRLGYGRLYRNPKFLNFIHLLEGKETPPDELEESLYRSLIIAPPKGETENR